MPAMNKSKVQQLTLSKHVKSVSKLSNSVTSLPLVTASLVSGIPRRSRAEFVLDDELLLQIKKGLESSISSKSRVKVKRLSSGIKPQVTKKALSAKPSPVARGRPKKALVRVDELHSFLVKDSSDKLSGFPIETPSVARRSRAKNSAMEEVPSSRSSTSYEKVTEKPSLESSNVYNLRSKPEVPPPNVVLPSSSKTSGTDNQDLSPGRFYSVPTPDLEADVIVKNGDKKRKGSDGAVPESKMRRSVLEVRSNWTESKQRTEESTRQSIAIAKDVERFATPRQTSRKRKSVIGMDNELHSNSKRAISSLTALSSPVVSNLANYHDKKPWVVVNRVGDAYGQSFSSGDLNTSNFISFTPGVHVKEVSSFYEKTSDIETSSKKRKANDHDAKNGVFKTPGPALFDFPVSSVAKGRFSVRKESKAKTQLDLNDHPKTRSTRGSLYSKTNGDSTNVASQQFNAAEVADGSILKSNLQSSVSNAELQASNEPLSSWNARLCQSLLVIGVPCAVAAYTYCFALSGSSK